MFWPRENGTIRFEIENIDTKENEVLLMPSLDRKYDGDATKLIFNFIVNHL